MNVATQIRIFGQLMCLATTVLIMYKPLTACASVGSDDKKTAVD
jgi:hypothetical protein